MTADTVGGVWTYAINLARALGDEGVEVGLATMGAIPSPSQRREAKSIATLELFESEFRLPWMEQPWEDVEAAGRWLTDLSARLMPDVIHLNEPVYAARPWSLPTLAVGHSCVLSWWQAVLGEKAPPGWNRYQQQMARGLQAADAVVAPSWWMLNQLARYYGVSRGTVIPNGRDATSLEPETKEAIVLAAGRVWDPAKNLAALELVAKDLPWPVYIAGDTQTPGGGSMVDVAHVHLLGLLSTTEISAWLRRASIYAMPARYEPFGLSVLEAALAGCALVLGDLPTLREHWNGRAVFVAPDEPETLKLAVKSLIDNPDLRHTLAMRGRRHALTLSPRRMARAYAALYSELIASRTRSREEPACVS
jgi:glycosyltransferase involved in cell wall biosynthesis